MCVPVCTPYVYIYFFLYTTALSPVRVRQVKECEMGGKDTREIQRKCKRKGKQECEREKAGVEWNTHTKYKKKKKSKNNTMGVRRSRRCRGGRQAMAVSGSRLIIMMDYERPCERVSPQGRPSGGEGKWCVYVCLCVCAGSENLRQKCSITFTRERLFIHVYIYLQPCYHYATEVAIIITVMPRLSVFRIYIYIYIFLFFSFSFALLPLFHTLFIMRCGFRARQFSKRSAAKCVKHIHIGTNAICQRSSYHIFLLNTFIYFQLFKKK
jgi:hypothetical protein